MTITKMHFNGIMIQNGDYLFVMSPTTDKYHIFKNPIWHIHIYHDYGGEIDEMFFSDCTAKTAWYNFYHMARRTVWYKNGR